MFLFYIKLSGLGFVCLFLFLKLIITINSYIT